MPIDPASIASEILLEDASWVVTRASYEGHRVLLRRSSKECPTPRDFAKMRYGARVTRSLALPGVLEVHAILDPPRGTVVVLEDFGGLPLRNLLARRRIE